MQPMLLDPTQIALYGLALLPLVGVGWLLRRYALRTRQAARARSRRAQLLVDIPGELRWRVFERDRYTCQSCGTESDLLVDFVGEPPENGAVRLPKLTTRCVRCAAIARRSDTME
jgi:hypothetical protein